MTEALSIKSSTETTNHIWLAAHLFYSGDLNVFIRKAVKPFIEKILSEYDITNYFFIRYWEQGPHIRLRFKAENKILEQQIKPEIFSFFNQYFAENPSQRDDSYIQNLPAEQQWYANNSIVFMAYEPETDRYGGPEALQIAEEQFRYSSDAVLKAMMSETWTYESALGTAIKMHLSFARAMGMDNGDMKLFFKSTFHGWFYYAYPPSDPNISADKLNEHRDKIMKAFAEVFAKQKQSLVNFHKSFLEAYDSEIEFEEQWLNDWILHNRQIRAFLQPVKLMGEIPAYWQLLNKTVGIPADKERLWNIMESYVHMTNNRLGILNRDEAYLGYLILESLTSIS